MKYLFILLVLFLAGCSPQYIIENNVPKDQGVSAYLINEPTTSITAANTYFPIQGIFNNTIMEDFYLDTTNPLNYSLVYNGTEKKHFDVIWSTSFSASDPDVQATITIKDGMILRNWEINEYLKNQNQIYHAGGVATFVLHPGEHVQLVVKTNKVTDVTFHNFVTTIRTSFNYNIK